MATAYGPVGPGTRTAAEMEKSREIGVRKRIVSASGEMDQSSKLKTRLLNKRLIS